MNESEFLKQFWELFPEVSYEFRGTRFFDPTEDKQHVVGMPAVRLLQEATGYSEDTCAKVASVLYSVGFTDGVCT